MMETSRILHDAMRRWLAAVLLFLGLSQAASASFDPNASRTISLIEVVRFGTGRLRASEYSDDAHRSDGLAEIAALDPKVQTLAWLALLENGLTATRTTGSKIRPTSSATTPYGLS